VPVEADTRLLLRAASAFSAEAPKVVGVAVSGGGDSVALLHLMAGVAPDLGHAVRAVTVDHGLRPESAAEAAAVADLCCRLAVPHTTLRWNRNPSAGNLPDQARRARYDLIAGWAASQGIGQVAVGHTADDQAETVLMGLARTAGLDGLCGMRPWWNDRGLRWVRPLLTERRAALRDYLIRHAITWVDDPTNDDDHYARIRARKALPVLARLGITVDGLATVAANLASARQAVVAALGDAVAQVAQENAGSVAINRPGLHALPPEIARRLLIAALRWVGGADYVPRAAAIDRVLAAITEGRDATLAGCRLRVAATSVHILREPKAIAGLLSPTDQCWDNRWQLDGPHDVALHVRALGPDGLRSCKDWRATGLSRDILLVTPAVWQADTLISAPLAGMPTGWKARIVAGFGTFVLSH